VKILQVIPTLEPSVGGVAPAVLALSGEMVRRGHQVEIAVLDRPGSPWLEKIELPLHPFDHTLGTYRYSESLTNWLRSNRGNYDRVIVNGMWQYPGLAVWHRFAGTSTPYYVFPHGMLDPWFKRTYPLKHLKKWMYWPWAEYRVLRDAAAVIFTSEQERVEARQSFGLYQAREKVSPLGVEAPSGTSGATRDLLFDRFPDLRGKRQLLFLGRLHPKKGPDLAIEAFAAAANRVPDLSLVIAGPDQVGWANELKARTRQLGLDSRIVFTGMLEGELKQSALLNADALILPSHQENFGMSVIEALALGIPVLISNRVNTSGEIEQDNAGYVAPDDLTGTVSLINRWCETTPEAKEAMRRNARKCFAKRFEIGRAVDSLLSILLKPSPG
jgi:glycosyltransferase involved in cell wall biosynthesis